MLRIQNEVTKLNNFNPFSCLDKEELDRIFANFFTVMWLIRDKKITKTAFFIELIECDMLRSFLIDICGLEDDIELYREILTRNPTICGSKMIRNKLKFAKKIYNIRK
jgi:hypothetical protein